jgi:hypothetical protein
MTDKETLDILLGKSKPNCYVCEIPDARISAMNGLWFCSKQCLYDYRKLITND